MISEGDHVHPAGWQAEEVAQRPELDMDAARLIPPEVGVRLKAVPFALRDGFLHVAMLDPEDLSAGDEISVLAQHPVRRVTVSADVLGEMLHEAYGTTVSQMARQLVGDDDESELLRNLEAVDAGDLARLAEQPSLINLVNLTILQAIRARASDIHIEPFEKELRIKYRIDGVLVQQDSPPRHLQAAMTSRVKIMAGMNIAERYVPQDGHITLRYEGRKVDIRVSTVPTLYGESVVMRILDKEAVTLDLETLGMRRDDREHMGRLIELPHGMVLVTGPTGSGKTTTLYAALTRLYDPAKKIITIEDPVEYELEGVNQIPVNPKRGLTFASGLRHMLRQDPDVIMVGEIRDSETAEIAVRAALTGHLVFSTLHTNNAVSAVGRLLDMGVEPFLLASVLEGVLAQRLARRVCRHCAQEVPIEETLRHRLSSEELALFEDGCEARGRGCEKCRDSGYLGRLGLYELLVVQGSMREGIAGRAGMGELSRLAPSWHVTMRRDGLVKASRGMTTIEQVLRATQDAEEIAR